MTPDQIRSVAASFIAARQAAAGMAQFPGPVPEDLETAYAIQSEAMRAWPRPIAGWKIGRVLPPLSERFGTDRLAGPVFAAVAGDDPEMPVFSAGSAAAETEFLLRIGSTPPEPKSSFTIEETIALIDAVHVGIEIASSPLKAINSFGPIAVVSDFGNNNGLVIGPEVPDWRSRAFESWPVLTYVDGVEVGTGCASSLPGGVFEAARFLFQLMAKRRLDLELGQWISSGAITGVHDVRPKQRVDTVFGSDLRVSCRISAATGATAD